MGDGDGDGDGGSCEEDEEGTMAQLGAFHAPVHIVEDAAEETLLLWAFRQPTTAKQNAFVKQNSLHLKLDACGHSLEIMQAPSSMGDKKLSRNSKVRKKRVKLSRRLNLEDSYLYKYGQNTPGVTGGVMWDSGVVLAKLLEHAADGHGLQLQGKKCIELGAGCGLVGCVAALLGANVILTDVDDRLRLLQKNVDENIRPLQKIGTASVRALTWGDPLDQECIDPLPDFVVASDVVYNEDVVPQLLHTLRGLSGPHTTVLLAGELRNDAVLEWFFRCALDDFIIGRVLEADRHPDFRSPRVAVYVLIRKPEIRQLEDSPWRMTPRS